MKNNCIKVESLDTSDIQKYISQILDLFYLDLDTYFQEYNEIENYLPIMLKILYQNEKPNFHNGTDYKTFLDYLKEIIINEQAKNI